MEIVGHKTQWELLKKVAESGRMPHAFLFTGENALGKKKVALEFIRQLQDGKIHQEDLVLVAPQGKEIQIDQIRALQKRLSFRPQFAGLKSVIIDGAHTMRSSAQNCFLKTLEEPKGRTVFFLLTAYPDLLLQTIRSRCEVLKFYPVSKEEMRKHFSPEIVDLADGRPGLAFNLFNNPLVLSEELQRRKEISQLLKEGLPERCSFVKALSAEGAHRQGTSSFLESLVRHLRSQWLNELEIKSDIAKKIERAEDLRLLLLTTNINQQLALENLMLNL